MSRTLSPRSAVAATLAGGILVAPLGVALATSSFAVASPAAPGVDAIAQTTRPVPTTARPTMPIPGRPTLTDPGRPTGPSRPKPTAPMPTAPLPTAPLPTVTSSRPTSAPTITSSRPKPTASSSRPVPSSSRPVPTSTTARPTGMYEFVALPEYTDRKQCQMFDFNNNGSALTFSDRFGGDFRWTRGTDEVQPELKFGTVTYTGLNLTKINDDETVAGSVYLTKGTTTEYRVARWNKDGRLSLNPLVGPANNALTFAEAPQVVGLNAAGDVLFTVSTTTSAFIWTADNKIIEVKDATDALVSFAGLLDDRRVIATYADDAKVASVHVWTQGQGWSNALPGAADLEGSQATAVSRDGKKIAGVAGAAAKAKPVMLSVDAAALLLGDATLTGYRPVTVLNNGTVLVVKGAEGTNPTLVVDGKLTPLAPKVTNLPKGATLAASALNSKGQVMVSVTSAGKCSLGTLEAR